MVIAQIQQWKCQNNAWNLFKVNNKDDVNDFMFNDFWCFIVDFE